MIVYLTLVLRIENISLRLLMLLLYYCTVLYSVLSVWMQLNSLSELLGNVEGLDDVTLEAILPSHNQLVAVLICDCRILRVPCDKAT